MDVGLTGKRALITGGSRGIGYAITKELAREGVACAICSRSTEDLERAATSLRQETGATVLPITADVTDTDSVQAMVDTMAAQLGGVDIVVNNAAKRAGSAPDTFDDFSAELLLDDLNTKFVGYLRVARATAPLMKEQGWGRIINISGLAARNAGSIGGGARNAAVVHLSKTLAGVLGPYGVTVNAIYPSAVLTEAVEERFRARAQNEGTSYEQVLEQASASNATRRMVEPADIAHAVVFLASPLATAITGGVLAITGGAGNSVYY